ncbi:hypothetical protein QAD02_018728 [Eretmocerus hayati]|uniref:Uncharacterized protein n=1 Tax=Eretmocerus hayati TaxID=131215 RepID=A0ACC2PIT2_9HYME|nr:hypothetical protein QAD02_018728 [Eretmocerus hayati]
MDLMEMFKVTIIVVGLSLMSSAQNRKVSGTADYPYGTIGSVQRDSCCNCQFTDTAYLNVACGSFSSFMTILQSLMMARCDIADPCRRLGTDSIPKKNRFDFIIVGAGVAGPVIARRLSENYNWQVLLIEAGPEEPSTTALPGLAFNAINSSLDWQYRTEPTKPFPTACLDSGGKCAWPRGKMVSGTGGMYGMMYVRGHPSIFDEWERMGNPGWAYSDVKKFFEYAENPINPIFVKHKMFDKTNTEGPMTIDHFSHIPKFSEDLLQAASELGYSTVVNKDGHTGFMVAPMLTQDGLRGTTSRYYLRPVVGRPNLYVLTNAHVSKVLFHNWNKAAKGVEIIDKEGKFHQIFASKEVILSAGAIGSPQILLQSGIGPEEDLMALGIPVTQHLPGVGRNLQNHVSIGIKMTIKDDYEELLTLDAVNAFVYNRTGPLSSTGLTQVTAFLESSYTKKGVPDIQVFFDGFSSNCVHTGLSIECPDGTIGNCPDRRQITARPTTTVTRSRGYLTLRSKNPMDHPLIYPNYLTNETDLKILVEGIHKVIELTETQTMKKKWKMQLERRLHPKCTRFHFKTDAYWKCLIRAETGPENHQSGTCRMGPAEDPQSVVNHELRVHGIPALRVADASIFPVNTNANPAAPIVMIAEKAAYMIWQFWMSQDLEPHVPLYDF